jgi:hypothetical protein
MNGDEAWNALADELAKGHRVIPVGDACEGFSYQTGCPGHETSPVRSDRNTLENE